MGKIESATGSVSGTIWDSSDNPIEGTTVSISTDSRDLLTDVTDANGYFGIPEVPEGTHTMTVQRQGFQNYTCQVTVTDSASGSGLDGVIVVVNEIPGTTSGGGTYTINGVSEGTGACPYILLRLPSIPIITVR